jgi:hypothetical protein
VGSYDGLYADGVQISRMKDGVSNEPLALFTERPSATPGGTWLSCLSASKAVSKAAAEALAASAWCRCWKVRRVSQVELWRRTDELWRWRHVEPSADSTCSRWWDDKHCLEVRGPPCAATTTHLGEPVRVPARRPTGHAQSPWPPRAGPACPWSRWSLTRRRRAARQPLNPPCG